MCCAPSLLQAAQGPVSVLWSSSVVNRVGSAVTSSPLNVTHWYSDMLVFSAESSTQSNQLLVFKAVIFYLLGRETQHVRPCYGTQDVFGYLNIEFVLGFILFKFNPAALLLRMALKAVLLFL